MNQHQETDMRISPLIFSLSLHFILAMQLAAAEELFPQPDWRDQPDPIASVHARVGGVINIYPGPYPQSFNYYLDNNVFTNQIFTLMFDSLLSANPISAADEPGLAEKWSISGDKKTFTFWLDPKARWSDGAPITAADVKWTFDTIMDPKNMTGIHKVSLETFTSPEIIDERQIRFTAREVHWRNLLSIGGLSILPRHVLKDLDFNKVNFTFPVVSGRYRLGELKEGIFTVLERRADWWGKDALRNQGIGNFQQLRFKFYAERENAYEAFKKGEIDLYPVYTSRLWINETSGEKFDKNWIVKQKVINHDPIGFQGFAMNMRKPPFNDLKVRQAMAYLLDREKMNATLMYNQYFLHRSYFEDLYDQQFPCPFELIAFAKDKARALLAEAGWKANPATGILEKNGIPFRFKFLLNDSSTEKFLSIYAEDLKDVGIELIIDKKDWAASSKDRDEFNFSMTWVAWSSGLFKDPEGMWLAKEADRKAGNNITGYKDDIVDTLIAEQKTIFDLPKRNEILRQIDQRIVPQNPYVLLWNINYTRLLYWNKFGMPATVLSKYGSEQSAYVYWWYDEDSAADLADAMKQGAALPAKPASVTFDEKFK